MVVVVAIVVVHVHNPIHCTYNNANAYNSQSELSRLCMYVVCIYGKPHSLIAEKPNRINVNIILSTLYIVTHNLVF